MGSVCDKYLVYTQNIMDVVYIIEVYFPSSCADVVSVWSSYNGIPKYHVGVCL